MAKYMDALARAQQERQKRMEMIIPQPAGAPAPPKDPPPPEAPAAEVQPPRPPLVESAAADGLARARISEKVVGIHDRQSPVAEQIRQICTNLESVLTEYRSRSIVVSSPLSGDGKTLVASNLGLMLADDPECEVLIVDADMRRAEQHKLFNIRLAPGLAEYLDGRAVLEQVLHPTSIPNLKLLPAGRTPDKPTVLLHSDLMVNLIGDLQQRFRWIIFDTPPLLPVTDASVLTRQCVGLILVVRMGHTPKNLIRRAQEMLAEMRLPVLGCVLNDFFSQSRENGYYYRSYHRNHQQNSLES